MSYYDTYRVRRAGDNATLVSFHSKKEAIRYADKLSEQAGVPLMVTDVKCTVLYTT